ncbi:MAG: ABC transporter ATP-binding protein [Ruminococcaceae bacterium]|nr:ABC transporter ATP-binding protein [Oscillospiraceae bacterium]
MARNKFDIDETLESPFDIRHLKRALVYCAKYKGKIFLSLFLSALAAIVGLLAPLFSQYALDVSIPDGNIPQIIFLGVLMLASIFVSVILSAKRSRIMTKVGQDIVYDIRKDLFEHLQRLPFEYYDSRPHGKILVRVINYINSVSNLMTDGIIKFVLEIFNLIFIMIFMFFVSWRLAIVVLCGLPIFAAVMLIIKNKQRKAWQQVNNKSSNLNAYIHESIVGTKVTQMFTREEVNAEVFDKLQNSYRKSWMKAVTFSNLVWPAVDNIAIWVRGAIYITGLLVFGTGVVSLGNIVAMCSYASRFWQPLLNLSNLMNTFINAVAYLERIFETMDEPVTICDKENASEMPEINGEVTFKNVTFAYETGPNILENLSFSAKAGESIALVGPTGAGKTTIVSLLSRFYDVNEGEIDIDGTDISSVTLHSLRSQMGIMLQDSFIFSGTIMDNIKYGKLDATDEEAMEAAKIVGVDEFISTLPNGYYTEVNERGSGLSQGQKQLISFARTILADPKILVLDEATSSIDAKTERYLQRGIDHLLKGRTSFIIAHRLSTIRNCDKIMYINNKGITECGNHESLIEKKGDYYKLYTSQAI